MHKRPHIAVVFNEPLSEYKEEKKPQLRGSSEILNIDNIEENVINHVDLSEIGVIEEREQVEKALKSKGYQTSLFNIDGDIRKLICFIEDEKPDLIFNLCESLKREALNEMHVAGIYELMNVSYTGSATLALGICLHKYLAKQILRSHGIPTPKHALFKNAEEVSLDDLNMDFPLIVKPSHEDASVGIDNFSVVNTIDELKKRVELIVQCFDQPALVEEYIEGRELNVAIMGNGKPEVLPISEIDFSRLPPDYPKIVTYKAKWVEGSIEYQGTVGICPSPLNDAVAERVKNLALKAYGILGLRDYGRIDIRLDKSCNPYVIEVNPNPDISRDSGFARSAHAAGMSYEDMINRIVEIALKRT